MKVLQIMILVFFSFSCDYSQSHNDKIKEETMKVNDSAVIGDVWYILREEKKGVITKCNVCPEIEFAKNGAGKIIKPSKEEINFTYNLLSGSYRIEFSFETDQQYFDEKDYFYKIRSENNLMILELSSKDGASKYTLSRE